MNYIRIRSELKTKKKNEEIKKEKYKKKKNIEKL